MAYKLLTAALLALPLAQALPTLIDTREGKIVGGVGAVTGDVPFIVSITTSSVEGINYCGGSLLNEDTIVTAGHCSGLEVARYRVRAGSLVSAALDREG
jgi:trypsin